MNRNSGSSYPSRRSFLVGAASTALIANQRLSGQARYATVNSMSEWAYHSGKQYADPFHNVELDVVFTNPAGVDFRVPAFWAGDRTWRVRYAPSSPGKHVYRTVCSDASNLDLHNVQGTLQVAEYSGANALYKHGFVQVAKDQRHFAHTDGTPFFWLGDTWWMALCDRLAWPSDFETLTADRKRKGFSVVQIVAGLYPDMPPFDPRGVNEAGYPWKQDFSQINPEYFDMADARIAHLVDNGIVPCIVGCWGYFLPLMGAAKMKQHWRNIIARWGAYPVIWCLAGEGTMPFYLSKTPKEDAASQKSGWTEMARYVRATDPFHHPITIHPSSSARDTVEDAAVLDFDMLQTGHSDRQSIPNTINTVTGSLDRTPRMPVLVGEVCYEGILEQSRQEIQRFMFWSCMLSGAGGHTYGANGIWQVNSRDKPYGLSPHGHSWGDTPWQTAYQLPGSGQLGLGKSLLQRYSWWNLRPSPESVTPHWSKGEYWRPFAGLIPGEAVIAFIPPGGSSIHFAKPDFVPTRGFFFNPSDGIEIAFDHVTPDSSGAIPAPELPIFRDWVMVLDRKG
jgi:hypothetical protein